MGWKEVLKDTTVASALAKRSQALVLVQTSVTRLQNVSSDTVLTLKQLKRYQEDWDTKVAKLQDTNAKFTVAILSLDPELIACSELIFETGKVKKVIESGFDAIDHLFEQSDIKSELDAGRISDA